MKKKAIEKIPYFGLKKISRKKEVKYIGVTAVKNIDHEKHLFLEIYRNRKDSKDVPVVRIVLTKKDFGNYFPEKEKWTRQQVDGGDVYYGGELIWSDRQDRSVSWMELQSRNIMQDADNLDRVKKFCNAPHQYNEKKWWGYIAAHEWDIVSTARRKTERRKYEKRKKLWTTGSLIPVCFRKKKFWIQQTASAFETNITCITKSMVAGQK